MPTSKTVNGVTTNYTYDDFQRLTTEKSGNITKNYTYDDNGNILSIGVLKGSNSVYSMNYTYDSLNRMTQAAAPAMTGTFTYTPNGNVSKYTLGGVSTTYTYDDAGFLTSLTKGTELSETYTYARNGNKVLTVGTGTGVSRNEYTYDGMGRLVSETADTFSATYTYDTFGNRATKQQIKDGVVQLGTCLFLQVSTI